MQTASLMALAAFPNLASPGATWSGCASGPSCRSRQGDPDGRGRRLALDHGVDGIVVSNHGGRQVDGAVASLDALVEVRDVAGLTSAADGRRGSPRLGRAQGAGARRRRRPARPALRIRARRRRRGRVEAVIRQLAAELDLTMALAGARSVRELDRTAVT